MGVRKRVSEQPLYDTTRFDYTIAKKTIQFIEAVCVIPEGKYVGNPLVLEEFQRKFIMDVFRVDRVTGRRVVRQAILSIARKNGKSAIVAALTLAALCGPLSQHNSELSSIALTRDQASLIFRYAYGYIKMNHRLHDRLKVVESRKQITDTKIGTHYTSLSADARTQLGRSPRIFLWDEAGSFRQDAELYDAMFTGQGAHDDPLAIILSTESPSDQDIFSEMVDYCINHPEDETQYLARYTVPDDDDPYLEENWRKANPALGKFLSLDDFRKAAEKAKAMPGSRASFFNLRLNQRIDAEASFLSRDVWTKQPKGGVPTFEDLRDRDVSIGIDLAMRRDLSALVFLAEGDEEDDPVIVVPAFFMPKGSLKEMQEQDKVDYRGWVEAGLLIDPPGNALNFEWVAGWMVDIVEKYNLRVTSGGYDRYKFDHLQKAFEDVGAEGMFDEIEPFGQGYVSMSPALDILESYVYDEKLWHGVSPLLTWNIANCVVTSDAAGNRKLDKAKSYNKIDGAVALAMALKTMDLEGDGSYLDDDDSELLLI